jgi:hypothetical protein
MSLVVAAFVPEGIVLASDSRQSVTFQNQVPNGPSLSIETVNSDAVTKTFLLESHQVGISSFGQDLLGGVPMASHIKKFSEEVLTDEHTVEEIGQHLITFMAGLFPAADTGFHVCGYKLEGKTRVPHVYACHVGRKEVRRANLKPDSTVAYGATWSGQNDVIAGLINPVVIVDREGKQQVVRPTPQIVWDAMPLQDAIDFSIFAIHTTVETIRFQARPKNVGGPIDVLVLTPDQARWIQHKTLHGE